MKGLINKTVKLFLKSKYNALTQVLQDPFKYQYEVLDYLIDTAQHTQWGRKYHFSEINHYDTFRDRVPVSSYEDLQPQIHKMMMGERDVLWPGQITWYSKSSGTTNARSKFLPVSEENFHDCHKKGSWDTLAILYHHNPDLQLFEKKSLILGGSLSHFTQNPESIIGDVSAIMITNLPLIGRPFYVPDVKVAIMEDWEKKLEMTADLAIEENEIATIGGVPTWNLVLFRKILEKTGAKNILEVWPDLRLYLHGGVNFEPYRNQFDQLIPREDFIYQEVYNASEGYFGTQYRPDDDMILLLDHGVFYEFIPMESYGDPDAPVIPLEDVQSDVDYAVIISTSSGLWRYEIGDTIRFTNTNPHQFRITGRTRQFINAFGEEVMIHNTDSAISKATELTRSEIKDYTVAPKYLQSGEKGRHEWLIEFQHPPVDINQFAEILDQELQKINSDYAAKRTRNLALENLSVTTLPPHTFERWLKHQKRQGAQVKVPRLSNDRRYVEDILTMIRQKQNIGS